MKNNKILDNLESITPINKNEDIKFIDLKKSKKYFKEFFAYSKIDKFFEFFEYSAFKKKSTFDSFIIKLQNAEKNNFKSATYQKFWLIIDKNNDKLIGSAKLSSLDPIRKSVEWGYGVNSNLWGKDYILKIQQALLDYVFKTLKLNRLYGHTQIDNKRVIKGVELLGFRKEGIKSDYYYSGPKKKYFDAYTYSFLKRDFIKDKKIIRKKNINFNYKKINKIISEIIKKKISLEDNLNMNEINEWDSLTHFDIISKIEKVFKVKFNNNEILKCYNTNNIANILRTKKH